MRSPCGCGRVLKLDYDKTLFKKLMALRGEVKSARKIGGQSITDRCISDRQNFFTGLIYDSVIWLRGQCYGI